MKKFIAVIGSKHRLFMEWSIDNPAPIDHEYIFIDKEERAYGRNFERIEILHGAHILQDYYRIKELCELRTKAPNNSPLDLINCQK
jgi:hypothetical protein